MQRRVALEQHPSDSAQTPTSQEYEGHLWAVSQTGSPLLAAGRDTAASSRDTHKVISHSHLTQLTSGPAINVAVFCTCGSGGIAHPPKEYTTLC